MIRCERFRVEGKGHRCVGYAAKQDAEVLRIVQKRLLIPILGNRDLAFDFPDESDHLCATKLLPRN